MSMFDNFRKTDKKTMNGLSDSLARVMPGYEIVKAVEIGEDDYMHYIKGIVMGCSKDSTWNGKYATWEYNDWSSHPDKRTSDWGVRISDGHYMMSMGEAEADYQKRADKVLKSAYWVYPGTTEPVVGCKRGR